MTGKLNILVVDTHQDSADSLVELFRLEGHRADVAYTTDAGVAAWQASRYDIAFLETECYRAVKAIDAGARIYMMTGHSVEQLIKNAAADSAFDMLRKPSGAQEVAAAMASMPAGGVVLVAEDDPDLGPQLRQLVESSGRRCELVANGRDALARVEEGGVDVLVLDLNMPLVNGIEVYAQLRKKEMPIPTVMITACSDMFKSECDALSDIERTGILHKPFDPSELLRRLERLAA